MQIPRINPRLGEELSSGSGVGISPPLTVTLEERISIPAIFESLDNND